VSDAPDLLARFLADRFPGLSLNAVTSRDERWPQLRFELGGEIPNKEADRRVAQAAGRASAVFEAAFSPEDDGFLSFTRWREEDDPLLMSLLPAEVAPTRTEGEDFWEDNEPGFPFVTYTAALHPRSIYYRTLFELIGSSELRAWRSGRAYLVNASHPLIYHMYDDRGAVMLAAHENTLEAVRTRFADWIIP